MERKVITLAKGGLTENQIESRMTKMVRERGGMCLKFVSPGMAGVPDRIVITPDGRTIYVELKTCYGNLQKIQEWVIEQMRKRHADVRVLKGWDAVREFIDKEFPKEDKAE